MGYSIQYSTSVQKQDLPIKQTVTKNIKKAIPILLLVMLLIIIFACQNGQILDSLLPGDPTVTKEALSSLAENVQSGESVSQAFAAFCKEIIDASTKPD